MMMVVEKAGKNKPVPAFRKRKLAKTKAARGKFSSFLDSTAL
jgi:hypothetical protein